MGGDETHLPEELRLLILRAMVAAAWADGRVQDAEAALIARKLDALALSPAARRTIEAELRAPPPAGDLGAAAPEARTLVYRNVAAGVMADGQIQLRETRFLGRVAAALGLPRAAAARIDEELYHLVAVRGLDPLASAAAGPAGPRPPRARPRGARRAGPGGKRR
jgi:uncharacterized membrane protein YebE (DUF533 family)